MNESNTSGTPKPAAHGDLARTPLAHVLLTIVRREMDGTLAVWPDDGRPGQDRIRFEKGVPVAAALLDRSDSMERGLLPLFRRQTAAYAFYEADLVSGAAGLLEERVDPLHLVAASLRGGARREVIDDILGRFGQHRLRVTLGSDLNRFGLINKEMAVVDMLRANPQRVGELLSRAPDQKVARRVLYLLTITKSVEIYGDVSAEVSRPTISGEIMASASPAAVEAATAVQAAAPPEPEPEDSFDEDLPGLSEPPPSDGDPLPGLSGAPPPVAAPSGPPAQASAPPSPPSQPAKRPSRGGSRDTSPEPPPPPPDELSAELKTKWNEISEYFLAIDDMNYFEMLEVQTSAGESAVQTAYFAKVKKWHPDRLAPELSELRSFVDVIFHHLTEAHKTLHDQQKRQTYFKNVQGGGGTPKADRKLSTLLNAAMEYQKVEVLCRRKDFVGAMRLLDEILEMAPEEADYHAMRGFLLYKINGVSKKGDADLALGALDRALRLHEKHEKALMTKAQILQRIGKDDEAIELYQKVAEINPKNLDATRQVRLAAMRSSPGTKRPKRSSGLFSSLFGGEKKK